MADLEPGGREGIGGAVQAKAEADTEGGSVGEESKEGGSVKKDGVIAILLVLLFALTLGAHAAADKQTAAIQERIAAIQAQQAAITARQVGIYAVQGWQAAMYDQYLEMGRVGQ